MDLDAVPGIEANHAISWFEHFDEPVHGYSRLAGYKIR